MVEHSRDESRVDHGESGNGVASAGVEGDCERSQHDQDDKGRRQKDLDSRGNVPRNQKRPPCLRLRKMIEPKRGEKIESYRKSRTTVMLEKASLVRKSN